MVDPGPHLTDVAVKGLSWGAVFSGGTFLTLLGAIGMLLRSGVVDAFKEWNRARKEKRDEDRTEEVTDKAEIVKLNDRMNRMSGAFAFLANAVTASISGLASDDTKFREETANRARELVAMAVSTLGNDDPFAKSLDRLASIPPVDRSAKA